jgi:hypothetical protein
LNDYPRRAYDIKQSNYVVKIDAYRNLTLTIPYEMSWNPNYIASLNDAIKIVADEKPALWTQEKGIAQLYPSTVRVGSEKYHFNEFVIPNKILDSFMDWNEVRINMEIKDFYNRTQYSECFVPKQLHSRIGDYYNINYVKTINVGINKTAGEKSSIEMKIQQNSKLANIMYNLSKIELSIVPKKVCVKNN